MDIKEKVKNLTTSPGVYLMRDSLGNVIYIGKAKNLKNRVQTYFQNSANHSSKIEKLIKNLKDFDYIITDTELEAMILECKLIRELKPMYNRLMKNPLSYVYIVIKTDEVCPSIKISNTLFEDKQNLCFGPYGSKNTVEKAIQGIKECYKILCSKTSKYNSQCLNYSLGLCIGMCISDSSVEYYNNVISNFISFLRGNDSTIIEDMKHNMEEAAKNLDFEKAAKYRDYINSINSLIKREKTLRFAESDNNIVVMEPLSKDIVKLFLISNNKIIFSKKYALENRNMQKLHTIIKNHILAYFGGNTVSSSVTIAKDEIDEAQIIFSYLNSRPDSYITIPPDWLYDTENYHIDKAINKLLHQ
ncbi:UvrB/UvrC motif-containing protein [Lutispora thermophila]|uniref:Excinuclease ABC subunit C n=1 Tax=Lutispora thermophila DSM 19022 TaxID=1122184 RepID=A0A1M6D747_9FIRM|nr:UvrB/UvrC motif-containing protein [Lutispora thermophila]SHI69047.1 excinuclease ABC subunit C [Lutispora thermophila DSM 19022]